MNDGPLVIARKTFPFCRMKITQDVRDYAAGLSLDPQTALIQGLEDKAREFREKGGQIYLKA